MIHEVKIGETPLRVKYNDNDDCCEIGFDDQGSWIWVISLGTNSNENEVVLCDIGYQDNLPVNPNVNYVDLLAAILIARRLLQWS